MLEQEHEKKNTQTLFIIIQLAASILNTSSPVLRSQQLRYVLGSAAFVKVLCEK